MTTYPQYVHDMLTKAHHDGKFYACQADAAALCFDVLALFPECKEASELVYDIFCDVWCIHDNRVAIQQLVDEWDDQPHQQRRRLALSYRYMSRWDMRHSNEDQDDENAMTHHFLGHPKLTDVNDLLEEGKTQLVEAYCLGDDECVNFAWPKFNRAIERAKDEQTAMLWVGYQCADLGFFADATDVLDALCAKFKHEPSQQLLAEVRWWRDNGQRVPWLPPPGDGSRYNRIIRKIDPEALTHEEYIDHFRQHMASIGKTPTWKPTINSHLASQLDDVLNSVAPEPLTQPLVDWSFLANEEPSDDPPKWLARTLKLFPKRDRGDFTKQYMFSRDIKPPKKRKRYHPDDRMM